MLRRYSSPVSLGAKESSFVSSHLISSAARTPCAGELLATTVRGLEKDVFFHVGHLKKVGLSAKMRSSLPNSRVNRRTTAWRRRRAVARATTNVASGSTSACFVGRKQHPSHVGENCIRAHPSRQAGGNQHVAKHRTLGRIDGRNVVPDAISQCHDHSPCFRLIYRWVKRKNNNLSPSDRECEPNRWVSD